MKVCIDANVYVSYLLGRNLDSPPTRVINSFFQGRFDLVLSETTVDEVTASVARKQYLAERITMDAVAELFSLLGRMATILPGQVGQIPVSTRDSRDDYLVALSIDEEVDYLVTGDRDLLVLGDVMDFRIVTPAMFMRILDATNRDYSSENGG